MKTALIITIILFVSALVSLPLLKPGLHTIHDDQQIARLYLFDQALKGGQFPPRWVDGLGFGFGYPLFVFYPPLVYMVGELFHLIGFGFINSIKIVFFLGIFLSGLTMYIFSRQFTDKISALVGSVFYILIPYRALDIYVRGALAESFSFIWPPIILWSFYMLQKTKNIKFTLLSGIFLALLMITHNLIFLPFMIILLIYLLYLIWESSDKKFSIFNFQFSILLAFGLSAFFWLPSLFEKKFTIVDQLLLVNLADYKIHFVEIGQLWNSLWGFGGSTQGVLDGISFKIGKLHIVTSVAAFILAAIYWLNSKKYKLSNYPTIQLLTILFFFLFLFSAFMTTVYSKIIWDNVMPLGYLQFPWRFLTFVALFTSALVSLSIYFLKLPILKLVASFLLITLVIISNLKLFKPQYYRLDLTDEKATSRQVINWDISGSSFEYIPKGVELYQGPLGTNLVKINKDDIPEKKIEIEKGQATIDVLTNTPSKIQFKIDAKEEVQIKANIFNFPGWHLKVDNQTTEYSDNNKLKLIMFMVPSGIHNVTMEFKNTPIRDAANLASLGSILAVVVSLFGKWKTQKTY